MERDIAFVILALTGFFLLLLVIFSLRVKIKNRSRYKPNVGSVDEFVDDDFDLLATKDEFLSHFDNASDSISIEPTVGNPLADEMARSSLSEKSKKKNQDEAVLEGREQEQDQTEPPKIIAVYIKPEEGEAFVGYELLQSLLVVGLRFGDMSIFHRHEKRSGEGKILFSLAQATEPGVFDINAIGLCRSTGLTLFMQLIGQEHDMAALKIMLETAQQLADDLNGSVTDNRQQPLTTEELEEFQQLVRRHMKNFG